MTLEDLNEEYDFELSNRLYDKIIGLEYCLNNITVENLQSSETPVLLEKISNYLDLYQEKVPEEFKTKLNLDYDNLKDKLNIVKKSIEKLKNDAK